MTSNKEYDTIIIGGGFYGMRIAQFIYDELGVKRILVLEKESELMSRASYNNQARVHNGYHYPRSVLTALRSRVNLPRFMEEYKEAISTDFTKYYGVATHFSKVSGRQFERFFERIGAPIEPALEAMSDFNPRLIEQIFKVQEYAFNSTILKEKLITQLKERRIDVRTSEQVERIGKYKKGISVKTSKNDYRADFVINTTYSSMNTLNYNSGLPIMPLKHELAEMCLVKLPPELEGKSYTIMCGPFFSLMPFPDKGLYTLSHVRYTPHSEWYDAVDNVRQPHKYLDEIEKITHFPQMWADLKRFMPKIADKIQYTGESLWEIKTVLPQSEGDDSRPILYKEHHGGLQNYICIMGGKIDNIYDVFKELKITYAQ